MNTEKIVKVKNHIRRNRAKYAAAATLTVCVAFQYRIASSWNEFLEYHNLLDEFYTEE